MFDFKRRTLISNPGLTSFYDSWVKPSNRMNLKSNWQISTVPKQYGVVFFLHFSFLNREYWAANTPIFEELCIQEIKGREYVFHVSRFNFKTLPVAIACFNPRSYRTVAFIHGQRETTMLLSWGIGEMHHTIPQRIESDPPAVHSGMECNSADATRFFRSGYGIEFGPCQGAQTCVWQRMLVYLGKAQIRRPR